MERNLQGKFVTISTVGEKAQAFVPSPLPPVPDIKWTLLLRQRFDSAHLALGRLDSISRFLPASNLLLFSYIRKEAVLSSMIEGTQSSISDLLMHELDRHSGVPIDDVTEVSNYVSAMEHGIKRLEQGFPISVRLIKELHKILLSSGRGNRMQPGELRQSQNWIGGTRPGNATFVPPPPELLGDGLSDLEKFIHDGVTYDHENSSEVENLQKTPALLKTALVHIQFETLHPFLDGNGRVGRLLITLMLVAEGILQQPLLYLSLFIKTHRERYYELLNNVRQSGDWESWLDYFAEAVEYTANDAVDAAKQLMAQIKQDAEYIQSQGRIGITMGKIHKCLQKRPIATATWLQEQTGLAAATVITGIKKMEEIGVLEELTGKRRDRVYAYKQYIAILNQGSEFP